MTAEKSNRAKSKPKKTDRSSKKTKKKAAKKAAKKVAKKAVAASSSDGSGRRRRDDGVPAVQRHELIAEAAYLRAAARGFHGGDPTADWLEAEREIDDRLETGMR
jgi:hypothetical protein